MAEEVAMLDALSGGRFEFGVGRGVQRHEFKGMSVPMEESRERFQEAIDVVLLALTRETFSYEGRFHRLADVSLSVKPIQRPHPPVWVTALSPSSIDWSAERGYPIVQVFVGVDEVRTTRERYEAAWKRAGHTGEMPAIGISRHVYVAETTETARRESRAFLEFWTRLRKIAVPEPGAQHAPMPGYEWYENRKFGVRSEATFEDLIDRDIIIAGDPDYCAERVRAHEQAGAGVFVAQMSFGGLEKKLLHRSMELFGRHVMPRFRKGSSR
jgi:alkanesulfonate monooxygenase SsuD/methylene tetrahydromethanopterin reductase-like flavin-dependent oxidoreductase (luciferase family)